MSTDRKDAAFDELLAAGLRGAAVPPDPCPTADHLAAFVEGGLSGRERAAIEAHAAACDRCQEALATLGALQPAAGLERDRSPAGAWVPRLRWLVPAAAAAAVIVYIAVAPAIAPQRQYGRAPLQLARIERTPSAPLPADKQTATPPPAGSPTAPAPTPSAPGLTVSRSRDAGRGPSRRADAASQPAKPARSAPAQIAQRAEAAPPEAKPAPLPAMAESISVAAAAPPGAAGQATTVQTQSQTPAQLQQAVGGQQYAAKSQQATTLRPIEVGAISESIVVTDAVAGPVIASAPGGVVRWRLESGGRISRSRDGGVTFDLLPYRARAELLAASAPAPATCWAVGRDGLVVLTVDGDRWEPRPFPERVDLVAIAALDARHATATARGGRKFLTEDGGATWSVAK